MTALAVDTLHDEVRELARERNAVILAHNYQLPDVQDVADYVGDSLGLSRQAAATEADAIVFCGVHFMAETAAILSPEQTVLIPDLRAGCSLAASIDAEQLRVWKAEHPGAVVVSYVNTTAEVKAEVDSLLGAFGVVGEAEADFSEGAPPKLADGERVKPPPPSADADALWGGKKKK